MKIDIDTVLSQDNPAKYMVYKAKRLKKRLPVSFEKLLLALGTNDLLYQYARYVINGRWPEAESKLCKDSRWACSYAFGCVDGRWPEAEETILNSGSADIYRDALRLRDYFEFW